MIRKLKNIICPSFASLFVVTHQTVQFSIGGVKNIFDFEYDFEYANMPHLLQNVTTCIHVSVGYALKHFERTYSILKSTSDGHACWSTKLQAYFLTLLTFFNSNVKKVCTEHKIYHFIIMKAQELTQLSVVRHQSVGSSIRRSMFDTGCLWQVAPNRDSAKLMPNYVDL